MCLGGQTKELVGCFVQRKVRFLFLLFYFFYLNVFLLNLLFTIDNTDFVELSKKGWQDRSASLYGCWVPLLSGAAEVISTASAPPAVASSPRFTCDTPWLWDGGGR